MRISHSSVPLGLPLWASLFAFYRSEYIQYCLRNGTQTPHRGFYDTNHRCPPNVLSVANALPRACDTGVRHALVFAHAGISRVAPAPVSITFVYNAGARRQCCPRFQPPVLRATAKDQDLTAAVNLLRWRARSTHQNMRRCANGKWLWSHLQPTPVAMPGV